MVGYNMIGRRIDLPERALEPEQFRGTARIVPERSEPAVACECSRCRQDVYQGECTYEDGLGQALCLECFEELLHDLIRHDLPRLARELGYEVVRHT